MSRAEAATKSSTEGTYYAPDRNPERPADPLPIPDLPNPPPPTCVVCRMPFSIVGEPCGYREIRRLPTLAELPTLAITLYGGICVSCAVALAGSETESSDA